MSVESPSAPPKKFLDLKDIDRLLYTRDVLLDHKRNYRRQEKIHPREIWIQTVTSRSESGSLDHAKQMQLVRQVRTLVRKTVDRQERQAVREEAGITPKIVKQSRIALAKEMPKTVVSTIASEGISTGSGWATAALDLHDKLHIPTPWLAAGAIATYPVVMGALWVNEKANAALLNAKGIGTDIASKIRHDSATGDEKRTEAKKGYWWWHGSSELWYLGNGVAFGIASGVRESFGEQLAANVGGALKLLVQAGITSGIAAIERSRQRKAAQEESTFSTEPINVFEK